MPSWRRVLARARVGFVFWPGSPRYVAPGDGEGDCARACRRTCMKVGVFVDEPVEDVARVMDDGRVWTWRSCTDTKRPEYCREAAGPSGRSSRPSAWQTTDRVNIDGLRSRRRPARRRARSGASRRNRPDRELGLGARDRGDAADDSRRRFERRQHQARGSIGAAVRRRRLVGRGVGAGREGSGPVENVFRGAA